MAKTNATGLAILVNVGSSHVVVKSYSKGAIDLITSQESCLNEFGSNLTDIAKLAYGVEECFNFITRTCNLIVHGLAHHAFFFYSLESWDLFLDWLVDFVSRDVSIKSSCIFL